MATNSTSLLSDCGVLRMAECLPVKLWACGAKRCPARSGADGLFITARATILSAHIASWNYALGGLFGSLPLAQQALSERQPQVPPIG